MRAVMRTLTGHREAVWLSSACRCVRGFHDRRQVEAADTCVMHECRGFHKPSVPAGQPMRPARPPGAFADADVTP